MSTEHCGNPLISICVCIRGCVCVCALNFLLRQTSRVAPEIVVFSGGAGRRGAQESTKETKTCLLLRAFESKVIISSLVAAVTHYCCHSSQSVKVSTSTGPSGGAICFC